MPAPADNRDTRLHDDARDAIAAQLSRTKGRTDLEILAVTGIAPTRVQGAFTTAPGIVLTVEFTYTTGRRQRRTARVPWALEHSTSGRFIGVPDAVWAHLNRSLTVSGTAAGRPV